MRHLLTVLSVVIALGVTGCDTSSDYYPYMPDLSKLSSYSARYQRMVEWGRNTCNSPGPVRQLINDYYPRRDQASIKLGEAASALQDWIQYNQYDETGPNGSSTLGDAAYAGCLQATNGWS